MTLLVSGAHAGTPPLPVLGSAPGRTAWSLRFKIKLNPFPCP